MPKDPSIKKVLIIGSGPIVIGQAAEFDYSGTQAVSAFKEEGVEVVLVNSNPATIMTDAGLADHTYIEPLNSVFLRKIIAKERPDCIIAGMGGQTGLNCAVELFDDGTLERYGIRVIGTAIEAVKRGEDRELFKELMAEIGQPVVASGIVTSVEAGLSLAQDIGYPVAVRPAYTLGGAGGGIAADEHQLADILEHGLHMSRVGQAIVEKSIRGWKEIEFEAVRDGLGNSVIVCSMENIDPVGVHTGDSIVVAPAQTLSRREYDMLAGAALAIVEAVDIKGGCNVQFALNPESFDYYVIEINPRVSRSSALASKATGYPIARVASKIAMGYALDEIRNGLTGVTFACSEPVTDYIALKIPKWPFDKFTGATRTLGTRMMATGEVMSIGTSFEQALLKAVRSLEIGQYSLWRKSSGERSLEELRRRVGIPDDERLFDLAEMLRRNYRVEMVSHITGIAPFFIEKIKNIVDAEEGLKRLSLSLLDEDNLLRLKRMGFSDKGIADFIQASPMDVYSMRRKLGILPAYKKVDTCAGEFGAVSPYYYSTYDTENETGGIDESSPKNAV
ncbi:MAG: carbamoyl-phosphate synthase large subunit, partial [Clostridiales bacterium]|nr:carbamoyl-phosphate synthase large subunit [Clostridiales bacterium]